RGVWRTTLPGSGDPCQYAVTPDTAKVPAFGGTQQFQVTAGDGCSWSVFRQDGSGSPISPAGGSGNGSFTVTVGTNATVQPVANTMTLQSKTVTIAQDPAQV